MFFHHKNISKSQDNNSDDLSTFLVSLKNGESLYLYVVQVQQRSSSFSYYYSLFLDTIFYGRNLKNY